MPPHFNALQMQNLVEIGPVVLEKKSNSLEDNRQTDWQR